MDAAAILEGPLGNVASCRRGRDAGDASSGTRQDAAKTPRDAAETRRRRGTRPGREKKDARDHPRTEPTTTKDDPGTEARPAGRERRARDAAQTRDAGPDAGQTPPDAAETPQTRPRRDFRDAPETPEDLAETARGLSERRPDRALPRGPFTGSPRARACPVCAVSPRRPVRLPYSS